MKSYARLLSLVLALAMIAVLFAGCQPNGGEDEETTAEETTAAPDETTEETTAAPDETTEETTAAPDETTEETTAAPDETVEETTVAVEETTAAAGTTGAGSTTAAVTTKSTAAATTKATTTAKATTKATTKVASTTAKPTTVTNTGGYKFLLRANKFAELVKGKDKVTDSILEAIKTVEKDLNCTIRSSSLTSSYTGAQEITAAVLSGSRYADFVGTTLPQLMICAAKGYILPLNDPKLKAAGLNNSDSSRWFQPTTQACQVEGVPYGLSIVNATNTFKPEFGHNLYFNTRLVKEAGVADLYAVVRAGNWTYEQFTKLSEKIAKDTNGDGTMDIWGSYGGFVKNNKGWCFSNNSSITDYVNGKHVVVMDSANTLEAMQVIYTLMVTKKVHNCRFDGGSGPARTLMGEGKIGFLMAPWTYLSPGDAMLKGTDTIGVVPNPKGPKAKDYATYIVDPTVLGIMSNIPAKDLPKAVAIMNAIAVKINSDAWVDMFTKDGYVQDTGSLEMLQKYIFPKFVNDGHAVTELYGDSGDYVQQIWKECLTGGKTPAQAVAAYKAKFQKLLDDTYGQ